MNDRWYYETAACQPVGPVSTAELESLLSTGTVSPTDLVWTEGMPKWQPAGEVEGLGRPAAAHEPAAHVGVINHQLSTSSEYQTSTGGTSHPAEQTSSKVWYYHDGAHQVGPVAEHEMVEMIHSGRIQPTTLLWQDGTPSWVPASDSSLREALPNGPPPLPQTPPPIPVSAPTRHPPPHPTTHASRNPTSLVMPRNPPRSVGWMTFWGFMWPGLGQALCGQGSKGAVLMVASMFIGLLLSFTIIIPLGICVAGAIDANQVARRLSQGKPVGEWEFFPETQ